MTRLTDEARQYWSASYFYRRATKRDRTKAIAIIRELTKSPIGKIAALSKSLLEEIPHECRSKS